MSIVLDGTNGITFPSGSTQNAACAAWVNFVGSSASITSSYNVSSITRTATGNYTANFTNALSDNKYAIVVGSDYQAGTNSPGLIFGNSNGTNGSKTTSAFGFVSYNSVFSFYDAPQIYLAVFR